MADIPIILLAAGGSVRMGQPKQLLPWNNQTLIEYQVEKLLRLENPLFVVIGSDANKILPLIQNYPIKIVINSDWETGMASSVASGMKQALNDFPSATAALFTLIDQPLISLQHFQQIINAFKAGKEQIVASQSEYSWLGVPALYDACYFKEIKQLSGGQGAKTIIEKYKDKVIRIKAGEELDDMDTLESYAKLLQKYADNLFQK